MAEIKDSPEKPYQISWIEIVSISTLLFAAFGAIIYASGVYCLNTYLYEMKLSPDQFPINLNDVNVVGGSFLLVLLGLALIFCIVAIVFFYIVNMIRNILRSKDIQKREKIKEENIYNTPAHRKKSVVDKLFVVPSTFALLYFFILFVLEF